MALSYRRRSVLVATLEDLQDDQKQFVMKWHLLPTKTEEEPTVTTPLTPRHPNSPLKSTTSKPSRPKTPFLRRFFLRRRNLIITISLFVILTIILGFVLGLITIPALKRRASSRETTLDKSTTNSTTTTSSSLTGDGKINPSKYAVLKENFPDPCLIKVNSTYYAFATQSFKKANIQVAVGSDISNWTYLEGVDALPDPGAWTAKHLDDVGVWAPSVVQESPTRFTLFYSALHANRTHLHCLGVATSPTPQGPYTPSSSVPLICDLEYGGIIDPTFLLDPRTQTPYIIYKRDGNAIGSGGACANSNWPNAKTAVMGLELERGDFTKRKEGQEPWDLLRNIRADGPNVESPMVWFHESTAAASDPVAAAAAARRSEAGEENQMGTYHLTFNSGCFADKSYRITHVSCIPPPPTSNTSAIEEQGIRACDFNDLRSKIRSSSSSSSSSKENNYEESTQLIQQETLLQTSDTPSSLIAPGGPALAFIGSPSSSSSSDNSWEITTESKYMIFHADTNSLWFDEKEKAKGEGRTKRMRSMFVAEVEYYDSPSETDSDGEVEPAGRGISTRAGIRIKGLVIPGQKGEIIPIPVPEPVPVHGADVSADETKGNQQKLEEKDEAAEEEEEGEEVSGQGELNSLQRRKEEEEEEEEAAADVQMVSRPSLHVMVELERVKKKKRMTSKDNASTNDNSEDITSSTTTATNSRHFLRHVLDRRVRTGSAHA